MKLVATILALGLAGPACAGVDEALDRHILPALHVFAQAAAELDRSAASDCQPTSLAPAFHAAFDAWMPVADLRLGPSETAAPAIGFWPDERGFTPRTLTGMIAAEDPVAFDPAGYQDVSIAARGFFALEMLLFDPAFSAFEPDSYTCALVRAIASDLARQAAALDEGWSDSFAATLRSAGEPGNATYLDSSEALRALYTQLLTSLEFSADQRLGRPMGTFEQPRPARAEAWRSRRSLRNVLLAVDAAQALALALADRDLPLTDAVAGRVRAAAARIRDPGFQEVTDPQAWLKVEVLQQAVRAMRSAIEVEIGSALGIAPGFNSQDGD